MLACTENPSPARSPANGMQRLAGVHGDLPGGVEHSDLAQSSPLVGGHLGVERGARPLPGLQPVEKVRSVGRLGHRLRRDHADSGAAPGDDRADREPVRLHRHAELARFRVPGHHRVGHGPTGTFDLIDATCQCLPLRTSEIWSFCAELGPP